ncbi:DMT family transporter [Hasllibacter sp. MH4015]|uniref:DMT family transporter n=1 Tax=Hasllibacter sp. MH4015 TaxID=2854029 RepID=UPI001CD64FE4|nr:DMT family transporter [Hasllibacter sp. MH4015]
MDDPAPSNVPVAALWMIGAVVSFSAMAIAGREASVELDTFELMTYRSIVGLILVVLIGGLAGTLTQIRTNRMRTHVFRNIAHFTGQNLWFWAVTIIPLAQVFALEFTSPLWIIALAAIFLGERLTTVKVLAGLLGFIGVLFVVRPGVVPVSAGMVAAGTAAIFFAITAIFTKRLTRDQSITCILFWLTVIQLGLGLVACLYDGDMALPSLASLPWVIVIGLGGLAAHFCITTALSLAPASVVMPIDFVRLPAIAIVGMALYAEPLEIGVLIGAVLIFGANYINILAEHRRSRSAPPRPPL